MSDSNVIYEWLVLICLLCASKAKLVKGCSPVAGNKHQYLYQHKSLSVAGTDIGSIFAVSDIPISYQEDLCWYYMRWTVLVYHSWRRQRFCFLQDGRKAWIFSICPWLPSWPCQFELVTFNWLQCSFISCTKAPLMWVWAGGCHGQISPSRPSLKYLQVMTSQACLYSPMMQKLTTLHCWHVWLLPWYPPVVWGVGRSRLLPWYPPVVWGVGRSRLVFRADVQSCVFVIRVPAPRWPDRGVTAL